MNEYKNIGTKVNPWTYNQLMKLAKKKNLTVYELLQMVVDTLVRYMSEDTNLTPEMEEAMTCFEHMKGWEDTFNLAEVGSKGEIKEATYYLGNNNKKGLRGVHIKNMDFFGEWQMTVNIQQIVEKTLNTLIPEMYQKLRLVGVEIGSSSVIETMHWLIHERLKEADLEAMRKEFEDANREERFGTKPVEAPYVRHNRKSIEKIGRHDTIKFDDDDNTLSQLESEGFQPFGGDF